MKTLLILLTLLLISNYAVATTIIVDLNGGGSFKSIQAAITAAVSNDTIKVWPGNYFEQITINKNIVLMGSGYENTVLSGNFDATVIVSTGKLQWFMISSTSTHGVKMTGGILTNCIIAGCPRSGVYCESGKPTVMNCILINNGSAGIYGAEKTSASVTNCIAVLNGSYGFNADYRFGGGVLNLSFSNGSYTGYTSGNQGCIEANPQFNSSTDFRISQGSACWDTGNLSLNDPDGSRSDMGYFGGPDCPIYPVIYEITLEPNGNTVNLKAKGRANY